MNEKTNHFYEFGPFRFHPDEHALLRDGEPVKLPPRVTETLSLLLQNAGHLVEKDTLIKEVWKDAIVEEGNLNKNIFILRKTLGQWDGGREYIETVPRRGYRFIYPVVSAQQPPVPLVNVSAPSGNMRIAAASRFDIPAAPSKFDNSVRQKSTLRLGWAAGLVLTLVAGGAVARLFRPLPTPRVLAIRQITHDRFDKWGVVNDGIRMYMLESSGSKQFLVQTSITGGETSTLSIPFANVAISDISPDHSKLLVAEAIGTENEGPVWTLPLPSGPPHRLGDITVRWSMWSTGWAVWSPNGRHLAFAKGPEVYLANADGGSPRKLTTLSGYAGELCFSPDSRRLRFTLWSPKRDEASIWEIRTDGSGLHPVLRGWHGAGARIAGFWSPDGSYYFFTNCDDSTHCSIWAMHEPSGLFHNNATVPTQLTKSPTPVFLVGITPDGKKLLAGEWSSLTELIHYERKSRQVTPYLGGISATELDFSRDGHWITYVAGPGRTLWRSRVDGSERLQLTSPPVSALLPHWSPDGAQIAFVDEQAGATWKIFLVSAQGGEPHEMLKENQHQMDPTWSPDGKQIAFGRVPWLALDQQQIEIRVLDLESNRLVILPGSEGLFAPRWSPDGQHLVALSKDMRKLMLFDFKSSKWTEWVNEPGAIGYPVWAGDGSYLYFDTTSTNNPGYRRIKMGQNSSQLVVDTKGLQRAISSPLGPWANISPDGSPLFERDLSTGQVYALDLELP